jgi:DNA invertase Pin-like site-specific DNA recombinase
MQTGTESRKMVACYVRVSTWDQEKGLESQVKALTEYTANHGLDGVKWYKDIITGISTSRPAFDKLQRDVFNGRVGTIVVWKLDRISRRGMRDGITILTDWLEKGLRVVSVTQQLDFSGNVGQLVAGVLFAIAAMERENLRENTRRGLHAAKARGVRLGKRPKLLARDIVPLLQEGLSVNDVANRLGKTRQAVYVALKRDGVDLNEVLRAQTK